MNSSIRLLLAAALVLTLGGRLESQVVNHTIAEDLHPTRTFVVHDGELVHAFAVVPSQSGGAGQDVIVLTGADLDGPMARTTLATNVFFLGFGQNPVVHGDERYLTVFASHWDTASAVGPELHLLSWDRNVSEWSQRKLGYGGDVRGLDVVDANDGFTLARVVPSGNQADLFVDSCVFDGPEFFPFICSNLTTISGVDPTLPPALLPVPGSENVGVVFHRDARGDHVIEPYGSSADRERLAELIVAELQSADLGSNPPFSFGNAPTALLPESSSVAFVDGMSVNVLALAGIAAAPQLGIFPLSDLTLDSGEDRDLVAGASGNRIFVGNAHGVLSAEDVDEELDPKLAHEIFLRLVRATDDSVWEVESRDGDLLELDNALDKPGAGSISRRVTYTGGSVPPSTDELFISYQGSYDILEIDLDEIAGIDPSGCSSSAISLCLGDRRFQVEVGWTDGKGTSGEGQVVPGGSDGSGIFSFFDPENWEVLVKIVDGRALNGHFWLLAASTTNLGLELRVTDTETGRVVEHSTEAGRPAPAILNTSAFSDGGLAARAARVVTGLERHDRPGWDLAALSLRSGPGSTPTGKGLVSAGGAGCAANDEALCLNRQRFRVEVEWADFRGNPGRGQVVPFGSDDSGLFWFLSPDNWEMLVKVLDGCALNDRYWVFSAATTNVEHTLRVTDTETGEVREYDNPAGKAADAITDTDAFRGCS